MTTIFGARRRNSTRKSPDDDIIPTSQPQVPPRRKRVPPPFKSTLRRRDAVLDENNVLSESPAADTTSFPRPRSVMMPLHAARPGGRPSIYRGKELGRNGTRSKTQPDIVDDLQAKFTPAKSSRVWERYVKKVEDKDKDLVEDWDRVIDVTLVFAALFSAMLTAFVLESAKNLQLDPSKATVSAILNLTSIMQGGANTPSVGGLETKPVTVEALEEAFQPTGATIWVNCLWFLSLGISISVSLFAMLAKRWSYIFRVGSRHFGTSYERAIKRQESWDAIKRWKMELVIEHLPTLMHVSLCLVIYLAEIHHAPMIVIAALAGLVLALYWLLTVLPIWFPACPMVTPFTRVGGSWQSHIVKFFRSCYPWMNPRNALNWCQRAPARLSKLYRKQKGVFSILNRLRKVAVSTPASTSSSLDETPEAEHQSLDGVLKSYPPPHQHKEHRQAFRALIWMLRSSKDKDIKEVLDHATNFPEVILTSYSSHKRLYEAFLMLAEHMNRLHHDATEPDPKDSDIQRCKVLCGRLIYLAKKYYRVPDSDDASIYPQLESFEELSELYPDLMFPDELKDKLQQIKNADTLVDYISWLEAFAARQAFSDPCEESLEMCVALSRNVLGLDDASNLLSLQSQLHQGQTFAVKAYPTLWWIVLINILDPKYAQPIQKRGLFKDTTIIFDRVLTWNHFRDSAVRESNAPWLTVVAISGILRAIGHYPEHKWPVDLFGKAYFKKIIQTLRNVLFTTLVTDTCDPFVNGIPVYCGTEVRLYEFDSLQYACDALNYVLKARVDKTHLEDIKRLSREVHMLRDMRHIMSSWPNDDFNLKGIEDHYDAVVTAKLPSSIWLASGLLRCTSSFRLDPGRARFLSNIIPDILFSSSPSVDLQLPNDQSGMTESSILNEKYVEEIHHIAALVWMPFSCESYAPKFRATLQGTKSQYMRHDDLWHLLCYAGVLRTDDKYLSSLKPQWNHHDAGTGLSQHTSSNALGCCLRIKAALVERLYSLRDSNHAHYSLDVLGWYTALAHHFSMLLKYWGHANMDMEEETYVITSLMDLITTLVEETGRAPLGKAGADQGQVTKKGDDLVSAARNQLVSLVVSGVIRNLVRPFSNGFSLGEKGDDHEKFMWYKALTETVDRLARDFTDQALQCDRDIRIYGDLVSFYKRQSGAEPLEMLRFAEELQEYMKQKQCVRFWYGLIEHPAYFNFAFDCFRSY